MGQAAFIKDQQEKVRGIPDAMEAEKAKEDGEVAAKEDGRWTYFTAEKNAKSPVTPEELQVMNNERDTAVKEHTDKGEYAQVREGQTFTSIDSQGVIRHYSPHDIKQSEDGRLYRVLYQDKKLTDSKAPNMPVIKRVKLVKGKYVEDGKQMVLEDNMWLRNGVLQAIVRSDGKYSHHGKECKSYRSISKIYSS